MKLECEPWLCGSGTRGPLSTLGCHKETGRGHVLTLHQLSSALRGTERNSQLLLLGPARFPALTGQLDTYFRETSQPYGAGISLPTSQTRELEPAIFKMLLAGQGSPSPWGNFTRSLDIQTQAFTVPQLLLSPSPPSLFPENAPLFSQSQEPTTNPFYCYKEILSSKNIKQISSMQGTADGLPVHASAVPGPPSLP